MTFVRKFVFTLFAISFCLTGCGALYVSPSVDVSDESFPVQKIPLTFASIRAANLSPYAPRTVPKAFFQHVPAGRVGALPVEPLLPLPPGANETERSIRVPPPTEPGPYRIGVGDVLSLSSDSDDSELSGQINRAIRLGGGYRVKNDGQISLPGVGLVRVAGLTPEEAQKVIFDRMLSQGNDPSMILEIQEFNSQSVTVGGDVGRPSRVPIALQGLDLEGALIEAGGIRLREDRYAMILLYRGDQLYTIPVTEFRKRPELRKVGLLDGDSIFVDENYDVERSLDFFESQIKARALRVSERTGAISKLTQELKQQRDAIDEQRRTFDMRERLDAVERDYVYIAGEVQEQARFTLPFGRHATLADALFSKGGFTVSFADPSEIYVLRYQKNSDGSEQIIAYHLDSQNAARLVLATQLQLRPNDVVFIEEQPVAKWERTVRSVLGSSVNKAINSVD